MRVVLTAGHARSRPVIALADRLLRDGHTVAGIVIVRSVWPGRLRELVGRHGLHGFCEKVRRVILPGPHDPLSNLLDEVGAPTGSLRGWARSHEIPSRTVTSINDADVLEFVKRLRPDGLLYGGGGILRRPLLELLEGRVLNAHSGPLPQVRGMNACEWALLLGYQPAVTIHFIDSGIDTGKIVERIPIEVETPDTIDRLTARCTVEGILGLARRVEALKGPVPRSEPDSSTHRQCYVMAPALKEVLTEWLREGKTWAQRDGR